MNKKKKIKKLKKEIRQDLVKLNRNQKSIISLKRQLKKQNKDTEKMRGQLEEYKSTLKAINALLSSNNPKSVKKAYKKLKKRKK